MIIGLGNDLTDIARVEQTLARFGERFTHRCFTDIERRKSDRRAQRAASYAKRFAAKEAFAKCWRSSLRWTDVWVVKDGVRPLLMTSDRLTTALSAERLVAHLSVTHTANQAAAVVVLERIEPAPAAPHREGEQMATRTPPRTRRGSWPIPVGIGSASSSVSTTAPPSRLTCSSSGSAPPAGSRRLR